MSNIDDHQIFWLGADATTYAVPCERCREDHRFHDEIEAAAGVRRARARPAEAGHHATAAFTSSRRGR